MDEEWLSDNIKTEDAENVKRRGSHIRFCCVPSCTSKGYRLLVEGERVQYFQFPVEDKDLCKRWVSACKIPGGTRLDKVFVCSKHFRPIDYKAKTPGEKKVLRRSAIPSYESVVQPGKAPVTPKKKRKVSDSETTTDEELEEEVRNPPPAPVVQKPAMPGMMKPTMSPRPRMVPTGPTHSDGKTITTLVQKAGQDGENISVVVVKNPNDPAEAIKAEEVAKPKVLANAKRVPLLLADLLAAGPPYPWRKVGLESWTAERLTAHEEQLSKITEATNEEIEKINLLQEQVEARKELLALAVIKKTMGRMVLSQYLRTV